MVSITTIIITAEAEVHQPDFRQPLVVYGIVQNSITSNYITA